MKCIAYELEGKCVIFTPVEGARLAYSITLNDGAVLTNRVMIKAAVDEIIPASLMLDENGAPVQLESRIVEPAVYEDRAQPVDCFRRGWPVDGATAVWAETEDEFVERMKVKGVPAAATRVLVLDKSSIPTNRETRATWKLGANCVLEQ